MRQLWSLWKCGYWRHHCQHGIFEFHSKYCCILFKRFFFNGFVCCVDFSKMYISSLWEMINKYCSNVIFSSSLLSFENCFYSTLSRFNLMHWNSQSRLIVFICNTWSWPLFFGRCTTLFSETSFWTSRNVFFSDYR